MTKADDTVVGVVGLGYVGLSLTAALANVGYTVIALDVDKEKVSHLKENHTPTIYEPGLEETLSRCKENVEFTTEYSFMMQSSDAVFITVGTPLGKDGKPNYEYLHSAIESIGRCPLRGKVIILKSTVIIGTTEKYVAPTLERLSGLTAGTDFYVAYCPERTIEGLALHELYTLPKIIGGINKESTEHAAKIVRKLGGGIVKVSVSQVAEICKLVDNLYRAMNVALANEIGELCESMNVDAYEVVSAVNNAYNRTHLFKPGLGADGPCLPKDAEIFKYSLNNVGLDSGMVSACIRKNTESTLRLTSLIGKFVEKHKIKDPKIAILGLSFKGFPETDDLRGSPSVKLFNVLKEKLPNAEFAYHDPIVKTFQGQSTIKNFGDCIENANVVVFLTNNPSLMNVDPKAITDRASRPLLILDSWHNLDNPSKIEKDEKIEIFRIGSGNI